MINRVVFICVTIFLGVWTSTTLLIFRLGTEVISEAPLLTIGEFRLFAPWLWVKWYFLYGDYSKQAFLQTMWPIYAFLTLGIGIVWVSRFFSTKPTSIAHGSSRWATNDEITRANLLSADGVILGQQKDTKKLIAHNGPEHILAVAPTRGGKGVGLVIPTLLSWRESAIIFDPKGENWETTSGFRKTLGKCIYFNPTSMVTACFNPLMEIRKGTLEVKDAQNIADIIIDPDGVIETRNHWQNAAHSLLVGTILHVINTHPKKSLSGVVEFLTSSSESFEESLDFMAKSENKVVSSVAQEMLRKHEKERSGVLSTAISLLSIFRDPLVANATDNHDFSISSLKNKDFVSSLYLVLPPSDISRLRILLRIMLNQIGRVLTETEGGAANLSENQRNRRCLFMLDEFPTLGKLEFFETALAYISGYGLKAFLICQSLNQLQKAYGERNSILDNCHVRIFFANNDDQTARRISGLLGEQTLTKEQTSLSGERFSVYQRNSSISKIEFGRPLLYASEINRLPDKEEIILVNGLFPILADKVRYYSDQRFLNKISNPPQLNEVRRFHLGKEVKKKQMDATQTSEPAYGGCSL